MRGTMWVTVLGIVAMGMLPAPGAFGQPPTQDSVAGTIARGSGERDTIIWRINASSGPSGEHPAGTVESLGILLRASFPVTCLQVTGNRAVVGARVASGATVVQIYLIVVDEPGDVQDRVLDRFFVNDPNAPATCAAFDALVGGATPSAAFSGSVIVVDAQPLPTSRAQCKTGGWRAYPQFRNQGDCVSFVATGGKHPAANT